MERNLVARMTQFFMRARKSMRKIETLFLAERLAAQFTILCSTHQDMVMAKLKGLIKRPLLKFRTKRAMIDHRVPETRLS